MINTINACDVFKQSLIIHGALSAYANMCYTESNQTHVGNIDGLLDAVVRIVQHVKAIYLLTECGNFIIALTWKNSVNKSRVANRGGCPVLVKRIVELAQRYTALEKKQKQGQPLPSPYKPPLQSTKSNSNMNSNNVDTNDNPDSLLICIERLCLALSSVLLYPTNHERMIATGGLEEMIRLCKVTSHPMILRSLGKVISTMVPHPEDILRFHKDSNKHIIEKLNTLPVLKKVELVGFSDVASAPEWLELSINLLSMNDIDLALTPAIPKQEFIDKFDYCKEFSIEMKPDTTVYETKDFRGLLFSIY